MIPIDFITYIIQPGDNLWGIAKSYDTTMQELMDYNQLNSSLLSIGQKIKIPINGTVIPNEIIDPSIDYINYVVKKGDNLYTISKNYNISLEELMRMNQLKSNLIHIGQIIKIPRINLPKQYTVKAGDNLYAIAQKYGMSVNQLKEKNNLTNNELKIGQILVLS